MPRVARKKSELFAYHVMSRSISEIDLFRCDEDKLYYISLLKRYKCKFSCKVYAYILMDTHVHIYLDPCGFNISTFMLSLNTAYVTYYNKRYKRHGHLYQGRFASTIVDNDTYSLTLTAYIHNNAKDLPGYAGREEMYPYSSYGIYTGVRKDSEGILDTDFVLRIFSSDIKIAKGKYRKFAEAMKETGIMKEVDENITSAYTENEYKSEKQHILRYESHEKLIEKISETLGANMPEWLITKYSRETSKDRAFAAYIMRTLCGYTYKKICVCIGNMSMSGVSKLANKGYELLKTQRRYKEAFNILIYI